MLHDAAERAKLAEVRALLAKGANANGRDEYGYRPIHLALMCRRAARDSEIRARARIAALLLDHGANPNARDGDGKTALWHALAMGPIGRHKGRAIVTRLMREKPDLRARDSERYAILHMASVYGYEDVVRRALAAKAPVDARDESGGTALLHAAFHGWPAIVKALLRAGADPNAKSKEGRTPLQVAAHRGELAIVKTLVKAGAKLDAKDADGDTALELAAWMRHGNVVRFLVSKGARFGRALHIMAAVRFSEGRREGNTSYGKIAKLLLANGADPNAKDAGGKTPLERHLARTRPRQDVIRALLAAGAITARARPPRKASTKGARRKGSSRRDR